MEGGGKGRSEDSVQAYAHDAEPVEWNNGKILCILRSEYEIIVVRRVLSQLLNTLQQKLMFVDLGAVHVYVHMTQISPLINQ